MTMITADRLGLVERFATKTLTVIALTSLILSAIPRSSEASTSGDGSRRRRLAVGDSISAHLQMEHAAGVALPSFTVAALYPDTGEEVDLYVVEASPSVTPGTTTYSVGGGPSLPVKDVGVTFLVSDHRPGGGGGDAANGFTFIAVDEDGRANGISQFGEGNPMNIAQLGEDAVTVTDADAFDAPDWDCGVTDSFAEESMHMTQMSGEDDDEGIVPSAPLSDVSTGVRGNPFGHRDLLETNQAFVNEGVNHHHGEHHHGEDIHVHEGHPDHQHFHPTDTHGSDFASMVNSLGEHMKAQHTSGRGARRETRATYPTDDFPRRWSYQVDLFIEIDALFVAKNGGGNLTLAHQYVNLLITAISSLYEREIDTHLHVRHIAQTSHYENSPSLSAALGLMRQAYGSAASWHHPDVNLQHALLGKNLGGGIAYPGRICDSVGGFGVSTNIQGNFESIDSASLWDFVVVAHELGHSFGSLHTNDLQQYDPRVDSCGVRNSAGGWTCSDEFPLSGSGTIMGYCHVCPGGLSNIAYTFGGQWNKDNRHDINNWRNSDLPGAVSYQPSRVAKTMWEHVSSRGTCVVPNFDVPTFNCTQDEDCFDGKSCTDDVCNDVGQCNNTLRDDCCGNALCEVGELGSCSEDCGPFSLSAPSCVGECWIPPGLMFDISTMSDVVVHGLSFRVHSRSGTVSSNVAVYTAAGSYGDIYEDPDSWNKIHFSKIVLQSWSRVNLDFEGLVIDRESTQAFYVAASDASIVGSKESEDPVASDSNMNIHNPARYVRSTLFGDGTVKPRNESISWEGAVTYSLHTPCSQDIDCVDDNSCTVDTCSLPSGTCRNPMSANCCSNGVCEENEADCIADCGPWNLGAPLCNTYGTEKCFTVGGMMFDVTTSVGISMHTISIIQAKGTNITIHFYTAQGSYEEIYDKPMEWELIGSPPAFFLDGTRWLSFSIRQTEIQAGSTRSFYVVTSSDETSSGNDGGFFCGHLPAPVVTDERSEIGLVTRVFPKNSDPFSVPSYAGYSFQGGIAYKAIVMPSNFPTLSPSIGESSPPSASHAPTSFPTASPFGPTLPPTQHPIPARWFMDWDQLICRQDCKGNPPCGGKADYWMTLYDTPQACCADSFRRSPKLEQQCLIAVTRIAGI